MKNLALGEINFSDIMNNYRPILAKCDAERLEDILMRSST